MKYSIDDLNLIVLNVGYAVHEKDWNWKNVSSPFSRLYFVTKGYAQVKLDDGTHNLTPGHMYLVPSFVLHSNICQSHFEHFYIHIYEDGMSTDRLFEEYDFPFEIEGTDTDLQQIRRLCEMNPSLRLPQSNPVSYDNQTTLIQTIRTNKMRNFCDKVESRGILYLLVSRFLKYAKPKPASSDDRIQRVINHIRKNIGEKLAVEELAEMSCLSKDHFIKVFKKEMGTTPNQFITNVKMERAMVMLATETTQIKRIAFNLGYDDHSYFNRLFKKEVGITPQQYRMNYTK